MCADPALHAPDMEQPASSIAQAGTAEKSAAAARAMPAVPTVACVAAVLARLSAQKCLTMKLLLLARSHCKMASRYGISGFFRLVFYSLE